MSKIICAICNKNQGGFIQSFKVDVNGIDYDLCFECGNLFNIIKTTDDWDIKESYVDEMQKKLNSSTTASEELKTYIGSFLLPDNAELERRDRAAKLVIENEERQKRLIEMEKENKEKLQEMLDTTGYNFEGHHITSYNGVISAEYAVGTTFFNELLIEFAHETEHESTIYSSKLSKAKDEALLRLKYKAIHRNSNGIIGIDFDIYTLKDNTIIVSVTGTAVTVE